MDFWIDGLHIGYLSNKQELISALTVWQRKHEAQTLYLVDLNGCQYPYADYIQSILDNCSGEEKVMFLSATKDELYLQLVASIQEYIGVISQSLTKLSEMFYVRPDSEAWHELANFLDQLELLQQSLLKLNGQYLDQVLFSTMLEKLLRAMEIRDNVSVGDLLAYQWLSWLQELDTSLRVCSA